MRDDIPAALPLIVFAAALGSASWLTNPTPAIGGLALVALLCLAIRDSRAAVLAAFIGLGFLLGSRTAERPAESARFVVVEAPIEGDWSARPHFHVLRSSRFRAGGLAVRARIAFYARFEPQQIEMEKMVRVEGHLRPDRRGGYAMTIKSPRLLRYEGRLPGWSPAAWNRAIANRVRRRAAARTDEIAMIEALLLGRGERLSERTKEEYKRGGTYHLLVFSGLQISLAAGVIAPLLRWSGAARAADWSLLAFAAVAPAFIGHEASVSRASTAIALFAFSRIAQRPTAIENLWCVAAIVRLVIVPEDLFEPAFHLTYAGAGALLFIGRPLARSRLRMFAYVVAAEIAIAPLTLFHFHQYALGGSMMTVLMTPIVFVMLIAGAVFAATDLEILLDLIRVFNAVCTAMNLAASPLSGFFAAPAVTSIVIGFGGAVSALAFLRGRTRTAAVILMLLVPPLQAVAAFHRKAVVREPRFTALDVGQGDALLIRSGRRTVLVDGGREHVLLPLLLGRGVRTIDAAVLTHAHPDHCGGLVEAVRHLAVRELWISPRRFRGPCAHALIDAARATYTPIRILRGGETIALADGEIRAIVLQTRFRRAPENNHSVIVTARLRGRSLLLTGDIERDAERELKQMSLPGDVLKVPHHGSRTSTSPMFLDATRPRIAVISCGRNNFFGHPHPAVVGELQRRGIRVWRTDVHGSIDVTFDGQLFVRSEIDSSH